MGSVDKKRRRRGRRRRRSSDPVPMQHMTFLAAELS